MNKQFLTGIALTTIIFASIGVSNAMIATSNTQVTVPNGMTMVYFQLTNNDSILLRDALCHNYHWSPKSNMTCADFSQQVIVQFAKKNMASYKKWQYNKEYKQTSVSITG